ncbi:PKD domain-containing protein [bacterium]|nr:PKD domain-containing protein [bacterium]
MPRALALLPWLAALLLAGCASSAGTEPGQASQESVAQRDGLPAAAAKSAPWGELEAGGLPRPGSLHFAAPSRKSSFTDADLLKNGIQMESLPMAHNAFPGIDDSGLFDPTAQPGDPAALSSSAWAVYRFDAPGYDRGPLVRLSWLDLTPPQQAWIGLSNWASDRWDFFSGSESFNTGSLLPYFNAGGTLYVVVLVPSSPDSYNLDTLRLGGTPPSASLSAPAQIGPGNLTADFDAGASSPGEGSILEYRWDFDGDGSIDESGASPTVSHSYALAGDYSPRVEVLNSALEVDSASVSLRVLDYWTRSFGAAQSDELLAARADAQGNIYFCGTYTDPLTPSVKQLQVGKVSPFGELLWLKLYSNSGGARGECLALGPDGSLLIGGSEINSPSSDLLLQKWSPDGTLLWSYAYDVGTNSLEQCRSMVVAEGDIYICGNTSAQGDPDMLVASFDIDGQARWARAQDLVGFFDCLYDICAPYNFLFDTSGVSAIGSGSNNVKDYCTLLEYGLDGSLQSFRTLSLTESCKGFCIRYFRPVAGDPRYYVAGTYEASGNSNAFLLAMQTDSFGVSDFGARVPADLLELGSMSVAPNGDTLLYGWRTESYLGSLLRFDAGTGLLTRSDMNFSDQGSYGLNGAVAFNGGLLSWGRTPNAQSPDWSQDSLEGQGFSAQWASTSGGAQSYSLVDEDSAGNVSDLLAQVILDNGGGGEDALLSFSPLGAP